MTETKEYILLARKGLFNERLKELEPPVDFIKSHDAPFVVKSELAGGMDIRIIHSIVANGPKLVELDDLAAGEINRHQDVRALPVVNYSRPFANRRRSEGSDTILPAGYPGSVQRPKQTTSKKPKILVTLTVTKKESGNSVPVDGGMLVTAFSDYSANIGVEKSTNDSGKVTLELSGKTIERLYCPNVWAWGAFSKNIPVEPILQIELPPLSMDLTDCVRSYYDQSRFVPDTHVRVGVIDTGVGSHDDLNVIGRYWYNVDKKEIENVQPDKVADPHGTFVAGLIGSRGNRYPKLRGLAPGVEILSYRVFGAFGKASTYALISAIYHAQSTQCDILNLSIEDGPNDLALHAAITDAREKGMLVVVAAGNDGRRPVNYPAAFPEAIAVSAMGCKGTFPSGALEEAFVSMSPGGSNPKEFIASFSNVGAQIAITAPGVGVLSTIPDNGFGSCSGTSMAAPVVTGAIASLLSQRPDIHIMSRNLARSDAIKQLLIDNCVKRGFGPEYEGHGMPDPEKV